MGTPWHYAGKLWRELYLSFLFPTHLFECFCLSAYTVSFLLLLCLKDQPSIKKNISGIEPCREAPQPPSGALAVAPPQVPRHLTRAPPLPSSIADRKLKTHSVMEPSWQSPPSKSEKGGKSASLPRGLEPPSEEPPKKWPELRDGCMVRSLFHKFKSFN